MSTFTNWSNLGDDPAHNTCAPNLLAIKAHLLARHGGEVLGCYSERNIRDGQKPSAHSHGAALDWRYENPGPGRLAAAGIINWLIVNHATLGVQSIHDYVGARIWHNDRQAWKPATRNSAGRYTDPNMGQPWAQWLHIETTLAAWADNRPIAARLTTPRPPQEDDAPMKLWQHPAYHNVFGTNGGGWTHMSPKLAESFIDDGAELIVEDHPQTLKSAMHGAGIGTEDLVPK